VSIRSTMTMCACALTGTLLLSGCNVLDRLASFIPKPQTSIFTPAKGSEGYRKAVLRFSAMHDANPEDLSILLGLARNLRYSGEATEALIVLGESAEQFSEATDYQTELGKLMLVTGDTSGAQAALEKATSLDENNWSAFAALGVVYDLMRTFDKAKVAYEEAFKACPSSISLRNNMAISAGMSGDPDKALAILRALGKEVPSELTVAANIDQFELMKKECADCTSEEYQSITSSIYAPGVNSISNDSLCEQAVPVEKPELDSIVEAIEEVNFVDIHIQFKFDSAVISIESMSMLDKVASAITSPGLDEYRFVLEGHTDSRGSYIYNQALSELRAQAVKHYLVEMKGIDETRLDTIGYSEKFLLDSENPEAGINRRVRITRLGKVN